MTMTLQKTRPVDTVQRMMSSIRHFERKLDKLQDDMNCQGQTLSELRLMVLNLSAGAIVSPDTKSDEANKRPVKKTTAIQHEDKGNDSSKIKRKSSTQPLPVKAKSMVQTQKRRLSSLENPFQAQLYKMETNQIHLQRHRKADAARKAKTIRTQKKIADKKMSKLSK